jgi:hypothetical protein
VLHRLIAVDPGGVHVGVSTWSDDPGFWACASAVELTPNDFADTLRDLLAVGTNGGLGVAYETFRLRGGQGALQQQGSTFPEVELIGVIRTLCRWAGVPLIPIEPSNRSASIQRASALGYQWRAHGHGGHAKDAEAVGISALRLDAAAIRLAAPKP